MRNHCSYALPIPLVVAATKGVKSLIVFLGLHLREVAHPVECLLERLFVSTGDLVSRIVRNMDIAYDILRMHVQCRTPGLMEPGIHVSAVQTELPHECVGIVIEQKRHVVMNPTIAAYLPAPDVAYICLVDAMT